MTHALLSGAIAFVFALVVGRPTVRWLRGRRVGKSISEEGPSTHVTKAGTPTMGGLLIFGSVAVVTVFTNLFDRLSILLPLVVVLITMTVGAADDLGTLEGGRPHGLSWRFKFALLSMLSFGVAFTLYFGLEAQSINVPWAGQFELGYLYIPVAIAVFFGTTSAMAITDGLDGLLGGTAAVAFV